MLDPSCTRFREAFEPGAPEGHTVSCPPCAAWAREVESLRALGTDLPLPPRLRSRLRAVPSRRGATDESFLVGPLPQIPLPPGLMARLYRIPSESRLIRARKPVTVKSGEMIAASLLFATLLTLGLGDSILPVERSNLDAVSRVAGVVLREVGNRGTKTLLGVGEGIFDGCLGASRSLLKLLNRVDEPRRESTPASPAPGAGPGDAPQSSPTHRKENPHGSRPTH